MVMQVQTDGHLKSLPYFSKYPSQVVDNKILSSVPKFIQVPYGEITTWSSLPIPSFRGVLQPSTIHAAESTLLHDHHLPASGGRRPWRRPRRPRRLRRPRRCQSLWRRPRRLRGWRWAGRGSGSCRRGWWIWDWDGEKHGGCAKENSLKFLKYHQT